MPHIIVVGDRFQGFTNAGEVLTVSALRGWLRAQPELDPADLSIHFGQGVSPYEHDLITADLDRMGLAAARVDAITCDLAGRGQVHKYRETNVLIANLERDADVYRADLRIHNDNEILLDHQTGLHVQGMVITEASRQMFLAVGELYLAPCGGEFEYYYVIERMGTTYENFLFPLRATIEFHTLTKSTDIGKVSVTCRIDMFQAGRRCANTEVAFTAFAPAILGSKEHRRAVRAIEAEHESFLAATS